MIDSYRFDRIVEDMWPVKTKGGMGPTRVHYIYTKQALAPYKNKKDFKKWKMRERFNVRSRK